MNRLIFLVVLICFAAKVAAWTWYHILPKYIHFFVYLHHDSIHTYKQGRRYAAAEGDHGGLHLQVEW